jgi:hypothetical protein
VVRIDKNGEFSKTVKDGEGGSLEVRLDKELGILPAKEIKVEFNELNEMVLSVGEHSYVNIRLVRCFPITEENKYIAVIGSDGAEIGLIEDVDQCRPEVASLLKKALQDAYLVPQITRVNNITARGYLPVWDVETDRGHHILELNTRRESFMIGKKVVIRDADGNRYEIADYTKLDKRSQNLVEKEV